MRVSSLSYIFEDQFKSFLDAFLHLYKRVCPSIHPSIRRSVPPSFRRLLGTSYAEYSALSLHRRISPQNILFKANSVPILFDHPRFSPWPCEKNGEETEATHCCKRRKTRENKTIKTGEKKTKKKKEKPMRKNMRHIKINT